MAGALCQGLITFNLLLLRPLQTRLVLEVAQSTVGGLSRCGVRFGRVVGPQLLLLHQSAAESRLIIIMSAAHRIGVSAEVVDFMISIATSRIW